MKKIISVIFAVLICIYCSIPAFADYGGYYTPYTAIVTNEGGAVLYNVVWDKSGTQYILRPAMNFLPKSYSFDVIGDINFNGELYLAIDYNQSEMYIKRSDVSLQEGIGESYAYPTAEEREIFVINKEGVSLRSGPSRAFEEVTEPIPYAEKITYSLVNSEIESEATWAYTEYKGTKGWLYIYQYDYNDIYDCGNTVNENSLYTGFVKTLTDGAYLTETVNPDSAKVAENIPANTSFSFRYYYENLDSISVFVEYEGIKGWLRTRNSGYKVSVGEKGGAYVLAENGLPVYENPLDTSQTPVANIPKNSNISFDTQYWDAVDTEKGIVVIRWMHVNYNGTEGWVYSDNSNDYLLMYGAFDLKIASENGLDMHSLPDEKSEVISNIPNGKTVTCCYESTGKKGENDAYWNFVEYEGKQGWILSTDSESEYITNSEKHLDAPFGAEKTETPHIEYAPDLKDGISTAAVIIISIISVLAVGAIVILIIKTKKKSK